MVMGTMGEAFALLSDAGWDDRDARLSYERQLLEGSGNNVT